MVITPEEVNKKIDTLLNEYKGDIFIPGFRRGKAPLDLIRKKLGKGLETMAVQDLIEEVVKKIAEENGFRLTGEMRIKDFELTPDKSLRFTAVLEVYPDFALKEYKGIPIPEPEISGFDEEFERRVFSFREKCALYRSVARPAQKGDLLLLDYTITFGEENLGNRTNYRFRLGDKDNQPELNDGLLGVRAGETREILVKMPADDLESKIAGKEVRFKVFVRDVKEEELPEINDELAQNFGYRDLADLGEEIKRAILEEREEVRLSFQKRAIEHYLLAQYDFTPPESLVRREIDFLIAQNRLSPSDEVSEKLYPVAEKKVKLALILQRIAEAENISQREEEIKDFISQLSLSEEEKEGLAKSHLFREKVLEEKVIQFLLAKAKIGGGDDVLHTNRG